MRERESARGRAWSGPAQRPCGPSSPAALWFLAVSPRPITGSLARVPRVSYIPSPCLSRSWDRAAAGQARSATTSSTLLPALACFRRFSACSLYVLPLQTSSFAHKLSTQAPLIVTRPPPTPLLRLASNSRRARRRTRTRCAPTIPTVRRTALGCVQPQRSSRPMLDPATGPRTEPHMTPQQQQQEFLSQLLLWIGILIVIFAIMY